MSSRLQPAHDIFYAPHALEVRLPFPAGEPLAAIDSYAQKPNPGQAAAITSSFEKRVTLLWGPPGTGKTDTLASMICAWLELAQRNGVGLSIALGASNYSALDNLFKGVLKLLTKRGTSGGELPVTLVRLRSSGGDEPDYDGVFDLVRSGDNKRACMQLAQRLKATKGLTIVGGMFLQMQKLSRMANAREGTHEGKVGSAWFDLLVLDEASQMPTSNAVCYACLLKPYGHVVVAGDNKQLGPVYQYQVEESRDGLLDCVYSYFAERHALEPSRLSDNYRTNSEIADWPSVRFYEQKYRAVDATRSLKIGAMTGPVPDWPSHLRQCPLWPQLLSPTEPVSVLVHREATSTVSNSFEAHAVACLARQYWFQLRQVEPNLTKTEFWEKRLGLVTPHRAQIAAIRNLLGDLAPGDDERGAIVVDTVDRFQGQERDLIISSYTVSDKDFIAGEEDFILDGRRFNVTLTRAKSKFIMLMSRSLLTHLPAEKETAAAAAHLQLFVEQYCSHKERLAVPGLRGLSVTCDWYVKERQREAGQDAA